MLRSSKARALWALLLLGLVVRALALWDETDALLYEVGGLDAPEYLDHARAFARGQWPDGKPFFWAPGYSLFVGVLVTVRDDTTWLRAVQVALGAASCGLVGLIARRLFERPAVTVVAMALAALYGPLVYYDLQISPATLDVFLFLSLLVILLEASVRGRAWLWWAAGVVAAACFVTRGAVILLLPAAAVWALVVGDEPRRGPGGRLSRVIGLLSPVIALAVWVASYNVEGDRIWQQRTRRAADELPASTVPAGSGLLLSYNLGINLLIGNDPELYAINHVEHPLCFLSYKQRAFEPSFHGASWPSAQNRYLVQQALDSITAQPLAWLRLMGRKALELVQGEEISRDTSIDAAGIDNHVLGALIWKHGVAFPSGLVIPLVVMGIALGARRTRAHALLLVALAAQALFVLAFFVTTRYRLPLITAALPYAACGIVALAELIRRRRVPRGRELAALVLAAGMLPLSNHDVQATPTTHAAFELDHLGHRLHEAGDRDGAVRQWRRALQVDPGHARAHFALARDDARRDQLDAAADHYRAGLAIAPDTYVARVGYAEILLRQERRAEAAEELRRVLKQTSAPRVRSVVCMVARKYRIELDGC